MTEETPKVGLVTGGNRGIGRAVAAALATSGYVIVIGSRDIRQGKQVATELSGVVEAVELDVTAQNTIEAAASYLTNRFGKLDVLINNAGIAGDIPKQHPGTVDLATCKEVFATNVLGAIAVTEAMIPLLRQSTAGRVVNVSTGLASLTRMTDPTDYLTGVPPATAYPPSKSALNSLTVQYAKALREDAILVNAADPGPCATDFTKGLPNVTRTAAEGAVVIVRLATLPDEGPTGGYFNEAGPVPW